jgi:hypothetical protein
MFKFKARFRPGPNSLITRLQQKRQEWANAKIAARIVVPPELSWWFYQEWGTAIGGRSGQVDETGGASGHTYEIPTGLTHAVSFEGKEGPFTGYVLRHPGVSSRHFVTRTLPENLQIAAIKFVAAMDRSKWNVETVRASLLGETMPRVKENIVQMIEITLPGHNPSGKLGGETAASAFEASATIVDVSES